MQATLKNSQKNIPEDLILRKHRPPSAHTLPFDHMKNSDSPEDMPLSQAPHQLKFGRKEKFLTELRKQGKLKNRGKFLTET